MMDTSGNGGSRLSFSSDLAKLVTDQLSRFITLNPHQLAGQVENLDFWLSEVRHAIAAIDGYGVRFVRLHGAQERYIAKHHVATTEMDTDDFVSRKARPVRRIPDRELRMARRALVEATMNFLERCNREGFITADVVTSARDAMGESIA
jgi:hypothetical protein